MLGRARRDLGVLELARLHGIFASLSSVRQANAGMKASLALKCDTGAQVQAGGPCRRLVAEMGGGAWLM